MTDTYDPLAAKLHSTTDAHVWAEEFVRLFDRRLVVRGNFTAGTFFVDEGTILGWFANAIETGRTAGRYELPELPELPEIEGTLLESAPVLVQLYDDTWINPSQVIAVKELRTKDKTLVEIRFTHDYVMTLYTSTLAEVVALINGDAEEGT